jgi:uncharacterized protein
MHIYDLTVPQLIKTLRNLDRWIGFAGKHAETEQLPPQTLLNARLAPDQYTFVRQVQVATDNAKFIPGRLTGKEWPSHPDTETTLEQLHGRIASVTSYVETFKREDFDDLDRRRIRLPWMKEDQWLEPHDYVVQFGLPNFYFHVVTAYAILRHKGVKLGKNDFIGGLPMQS